MVHLIDIYQLAFHSLFFSRFNSWKKAFAFSAHIHQNQKLEKYYLLNDSQAPNETGKRDAKC